NGDTINDSVGRININTCGPAVNDSLAVLDACSGPIAICSTISLINENAGKAVSDDVFFVSICTAYGHIDNAPTGIIICTSTIHMNSVTETINLISNECSI